MPEQGVTRVLCGYAQHADRTARAAGRKFADREVPGAQSPRAGSTILHSKCQTSQRRVQEFEALGKRILGPTRIGAHGTPVFFLHPKDMGGVLTEIMEWPGHDDGPGGVGGQGGQGSQGPRPHLAHARGDRRSSRSTPRGGTRRTDPARLRAVHPRPLCQHVCRPAVDDPPICGLLDRRGEQRLLPPQSRRRAEGPVGRVRSRDPSRLRFRPSARGRRCRQGGRRDRHGRGHEAAVRRHPAGRDVASA